MTEASRSSGTGPGVLTPDGCSVEFYARMTEMGELAAVLADAGLRLDRYLTDNHEWFRAVPA